MADLIPLLPRKIPQSVFPPIGDADAPPTLAPLGEAAMGGGLQSLLPSSSPNVTLNNRIGDSNGSRQSLLEADLYKRDNPIKPTTSMGKIGHIAAGIGNALGNIFAPATMALIPGTELHNQIQKNRDSAELDDISSLQTQADQRKQTEALTDYTEQRPEIEKAKLQQRMDVQRVRSDQAAAKAGQKPVEDPETGDVSYVDDPNSAAYQSRKIHDDVEQSKKAVQDADTQVKQASIDPNSPTYKLALTRAEIARQNASAAVTRAQAYYGNYLQHAFNKDLQGNTLPGAPQIENGSGQVTTVGSTNAPQAVKAQGNAAQFNDVHGALDNLETNARALVASGGKLNSPGVVYALQHSSGTPGQFLQSLDKGNLSPQERQYVQSVVAAHENVQALRKAAGGTSTDSAVAKLDSLIPNGSTPDLDYLLGQTSQIRQTADRLGKGVTTVQGGLGVHGGTANGGAPSHSGQPVEQYERVNGKLVKVTK